MSRAKLAVVGGGLSGLAAAWELGRLLPGSRITLYEASDRLGGKIRTVRREGFLMEAAADAFLADKPGGVDACRALGLEDELISPLPQPAGVLLYQRGRLLPLPEGMAHLAPTRLLPFLRSPLFSPWGKLQVLLERLRPARDAGEESIARFVRRRFGEEALRKVGQPLLAGIYGGDAERLSLEATFPRLKELEREHGSVTRGLSRARPGRALGYAHAFVSLMGGMERLVEGLARALRAVEVRLSTRLEALPAAEGTILAVPAGEAARLVSDARLAGLLRRQRSTPVLSVSLGYRRAAVGHPLGAYGFLVPPGSGLRLTGATFSSSKLPGRAPGDNVLLRAFYPDPALEPELPQLAHRELSELLEISEPPLVTEAFVFPQANPQYELGHPAWLAELEEALEAHPRLVLAGASYRGVGVPDCIQQGRQAARRLARRLS